MAILEVSNLKKIYTTRFGGNQVQALKNINFSVEEGEYVAIMGESGSGKTTLLNILAALDKPTAGEVLLNGKNLVSLKEKEISAFRREHLGFVFQDFNLLDNFSLKDNIFLPLVLSGVDYRDMEKRLAPIASLLGIEKLLNKYPYEVSGGQKQRAAVARAIITNPELILADEPTGALDSKATDSLLRLFNRINEDGQTILMVTHSTKAASHANRVLSLFFVAVLLVIVGTYLLFISGSIVILKALRKNKKFYYNKKHFAAVSGMIYRMKQNAGGLASICVLSTMVLVVVSTTVSMYAGMEGELKQRYPSDISVYSWYKEVPADVNLDDALKEAAADSDKIIADSACNVKDSKSYTYFSWTVFREGTEFKPVLSYDNDISLLYFVTGDEIDEMETGFKESLNKKIPQLDTGSVAVYGTEKFNGDIINLLGKEFKVAAAEKTAVSKDSYMSSMYSGVYYVVVDSKATLAEIFNLNSSLGGDSVPTMLNNEIDYNLYGSSEDKLAVAKALDKHFEENSVKSDVSGFYEESRDANREQIYVLYGGLFFIGIFLGTMFLMVTVMIIFYKQISEGYDDKARYEIMEKVGMSNDEVKKSITSQVRMVFFLPIILAACHLAAAFPLLRRLLVMFNLTDIKLIAICMSATFLVFVAIYYIVFKITSRAYYRIVGNQI